MRVLVLVTALCAAAVAACGSGTEGTMPPPPAEMPPTAEASSRPPAPALEGETLEGEAIALADFRGKAVFVNVWSSW